ncbi:MAG: hypothetical protein IID46_04700 [Planctomycetes bacterium]|nr:hypothetical protein [Planctomycetota bacterium]
MSVMGPGTLGSFNLAGSVAGSQRNNSGEDRVKETSADRKFQADQRTLSASSLEDVAETDLLSERDPDGRLLYSSQEQEQQDSLEISTTDQSSCQSGRNSDAFGERGISLDVEA